MITVLVIMSLGILIGWFLHAKKKLIKLSSEITNWAIYLLLFLLGLSVGTNKEILNNFDEIGYQSIIITIFVNCFNSHIAIFIYIITYNIIILI